MGLAERVNLDANATYGLLPEVQRGLVQLLPELGGNPSSIHFSGQRARGIIEEARAQVGAALALGPRDMVIFTSGATEANNTFIQGVDALERTVRERGEPRFLTSAIEHPSVLEPARALRVLGWQIDEVYPGESPAMLLESFATAVTPLTRAVSLMMANNETGELLPIREIFSRVRACSSALCHSDITQAFGRVPLRFSEVEADAVSFSGHKLGSLPGVGVLVLRDGVRLPPLLRGGVQEQRQRAGTENVLGIASLAIALQSIERRRTALGANLERFLTPILKACPEIALVRASFPRIPNTACLHLPGLSAADLVVALDLAGVEISFGSACASGKPDPSHVLLALGLSEATARECVRVSVRSEYPEGALARAAEIFIGVVGNLRNAYPKVAHG